MREIKFRVFWGAQMQYSPRVMSEECYEERDCSPEHCYVDINKVLRDGQKDADIWMQYTGLKDKNGIEIYEFDIVMVEINDSHGFLKNTKENRYGIVFWDKIIASFKVGFSGLNTYMGFFEDIKVVGNKYQNSDLMIEVCGSGSQNPRMMEAIK